MDSNSPSSPPLFRHKKSPSSDRFLIQFSQPSETSSTYELHEHDILWTGEHSSEPPQIPATGEFPTSPKHPPNSMPTRTAVVGFRLPENSGILAALDDDKKRTLGHRPFLRRKASIVPLSSSPSRMIPAIPKPQSPKEYSSQSVPFGKFHQSAPMKVPVIPIAGGRRGVLVENDDVDGDDEMLPPHEMVARGSARSPMTTFSVLEGAGRTLKGRDLRQVRNAVWRRTGFLD
ncbi:protein S40-7-like [Tasmannia lanceolata]|uniref:protein S40-7-like n=1 Tax=Tasmannia lanceolata TaxID=3420 RepID=UPI0040640010